MLNNVALSNNVNYDAMTGIITVERGGIFFVAWWLQFIVTESSTNFSTALINIAGNTLATSGLRFNNPGNADPVVLSTNQLIQLNRGEGFSLVNITGVPIRLTPTQNFSAELVLARLAGGVLGC